MAEGQYCGCVFDRYPLWWKIELRWGKGGKSGYGGLSWHSSVLVQDSEKLKNSTFNLDSSLRFFEELKRRMPGGARGLVNRSCLS